MIEVATRQRSAGEWYRTREQPGARQAGSPRASDLLPRATHHFTYSGSSLVTSHSPLPLSHFVAGVQSALFLRGLFPPPAAFALMLAGQYSFRARLAADGDESPFVQ